MTPRDRDEPPDDLDSAAPTPTPDPGTTLSPAVKSLLAQLTAAKAAAASPAAEALIKQTAAAAEAASSPAVSELARQLARAASAPQLPGSASSAALEAFLRSPTLDAARQSLATSGALRALALSTPAPTSPSPLLTALVSNLPTTPSLQLPPTAPRPRLPPAEFAPSLPSLPPTPPHRLAPQRWRRTVTNAVTQLGAQLTRRHEGAWDAIFHSGPDSVSQAAGSIVELIKGALRASATAAQMNEWLNSVGAPDWGRDARGFPTIRARAHFLLTQSGVPERSADALALGLTRLCTDLEEVKHGRVEASMQFVVSALLFFEAMLVASSPV